MPADADVLAFDANTRSATPELAASRTVEIVRGHPAEIVYKKIDSTLRGNPGIEVAAALEEFRRRHPRAFAVIAPAFPAMGRTTKYGWQYVRGERLANGELSRMFPDAVICNAETDDDLREIALRWMAHAPLWVGSAGLVRWLPAAAGIEKKALPHFPKGDGPIVCGVGSRSECSREQVASLRESDADSCVVVTGDAAEVAEAVARMPDPIGGLVLTGGDTARAVLVALGVKALRILGEVETGIPISVSEDERRLPVITKAGDFGTRDILLRCREVLR